MANHRACFRNPVFLCSAVVWMFLLGTDGVEAVSGEDISRIETTDNEGDDDKNTPHMLRNARDRFLAEVQVNHIFT